ncbi:MAG TPA: N-acylglucosamine 2-epimerase, partial [Streptosporangiaceae bacterium]
DGNGGFFDTAAGAERLIYRPADPADNATPSGTFAAAGALLSYGALTGSARHRDAALAALAVLPALAGRFPRAAGWGLAVAEGVLAGPAEIAVVGPPGDERTRELLRTALEAAPPGAVLAVGNGADPGGTGFGGTSPDAAPVPLLTGRGLVNGAAAAYVCRNFACQLPVTDPAELRAALSPAR